MPGTHHLRARCLFWILYASTVEVGGYVLTQIPMGFAGPVGSPGLPPLLLPLERDAHLGPDLWLVSVQHPTPVRALGSSQVP